VALIFLGDKFCKHLLLFAFAGFCSKFSGEDITGTDPDFIRGVCNDTGFDPGSAFQAIGFEDMERGWSKLFRAIWNLYLARVPVYDGVDFLQPWQSQYNIFGTKISNKKIGWFVS
jgi:hypothetical protein